MVLTFIVIAAIIAYFWSFRPRSGPSVSITEVEKVRIIEPEHAVPETPEEGEVRRAKEAAIQAERADRAGLAEHHQAQEAVRKKLELANKYMNDSGISSALPRAWDTVRFWGSWAANADRWTAPEGFSDISGSTGPDQWAAWRYAGHSYRIGYETRRNYFPDDYDRLCRLTLESDGEVVTVIDCSQGPESDSWRYTVVDALKVGPWMAEFVAMEAQLRRDRQFEAKELLAAIDRERASRINLNE